MDRLIMVSFPRSGSNLLLSIIKQIINEFINVEKDICYNYGKCNTVPCSCNPPAYLTKTHDDFGNIVEIKDEFKYIVILQKDTVFSLEADYRYHLNIKKGFKDPTQTNFNLDEKDIDSSFILHRYKEYNRFYKKWVREESNILIIYTEDIINEPEKIIKEIFSFLQLNKNNQNNHSINSYINELKTKTNFKPKIKNNIYHLIDEIIRYE